jgi:hypothetical protein
VSLLSVFRSCVYMATDIKTLLWPGQLADMCRNRDYNRVLAGTPGEVELQEAEEQDEVLPAGWGVNKSNRPEAVSPCLSWPHKTAEDYARDSLKTLQDSRWPHGARYTCHCGHQLQQHPTEDLSCTLCSCISFKQPPFAIGVPAPGEMCVCGHTAYNHTTDGCHASDNYVIPDCTCGSFEALPVPPAGDQVPGGVETPPTPPPPGISETAELIAEVLREHHGWYGHRNGGYRYYPCSCGFSDAYNSQDFAEVHVAPLIAERLKSSLTQQAPS